MNILKNILDVKKKTGLLIPAIDNHLLKIVFDVDRNHGLNSPSQISKCIRSQVYTRSLEKRDGSITPRTQRIFDNGTGVHERLQDYLVKSGILLLTEAPLFNLDYEIMGSTDGILAVSEKTGELGILEIKSINSIGFKNLTDAKNDHKQQACIYAFCLESFRKKIQESVKEEKFNVFRATFLTKYRKVMSGFISGGSKYSKKDKINFRVKCMDELMTVLRPCKVPINKLYFLYECKDTQELKEFCVEITKDMMEDVLAIVSKVNYYMKRGEVPERPVEATGENCNYCKWCDFRLKCYH